MDAQIQSKAQAYLRSKIAQQWDALTNDDLDLLFGTFATMWDEAIFSEFSRLLVELLLRRYCMNRFEIELQLTALLNDIEADIARTNIRTPSHTADVTRHMFDQLLRNSLHAA